MAADLGLVAHAAERHADELAAGRAGDRLADRGLAGAGRADQREDRAGALVLRDAPLGAQLAHGQVLGDAVLDVLEAGVVGVEHLARVHGVEPLVGALAPRHGDQPVEVGADHRGLAGLLAHALEPAELRSACSRDGLGHAGLVDLGAVLLDDRARSSSPSSLRIDSICLRRKYSRCCLLGAGLARPRGCAGAPAARRAARAGAATASSRRSVTSSVSSSSTFCSKREVGRVADRCRPARRARRSRAGTRRCGRRRRAARGSPRRRRGTRARARGCGRRRARRRGARRPRRAGGRRVGAGRRRRRRGAAPASATARPPPGRRTRSATSAIVPTSANSLVVTGDEQDALLVADVDGQRDVHGREDDGVVERNQK